DSWVWIHDPPFPYSNIPLFHSALRKIGGTNESIMDFDHSAHRRLIFPHSRLAGRALGRKPSKTDQQRRILRSKNVGGRTKNLDGAGARLSRKQNLGAASGRAQEGGL